MTTEAQVLEETIKILEKGFTSKAYFKYEGGSWSTAVKEHQLSDGTRTPGPEVVSTCAIGGVEQGIWKLTGKVVTGSRKQAAYQPESTHYKDETRVLYAKVMKRVNRISKQLFDKQFIHDGFGDRRSKGKPFRVDNVERVTFTPGSERAKKQRTLKVFRTALEEVRG
jgi:hypothetical protein